MQPLLLLLFMFSVVHYLHVHVYEHKVSLHKVRFTHVYTTGYSIFNLLHNISYYSTQLQMSKGAYLYRGKQIKTHNIIMH